MRFKSVFIFRSKGILNHECELCYILYIFLTIVISAFSNSESCARLIRQHPHKYFTDILLFQKHVWN